MYAALDKTTVVVDRPSCRGGPRDPRAGHELHCVTAFLCSECWSQQQENVTKLEATISLRSESEVGVRD